MVLRVQNDYGTLSCRFNGITVWFCDNGSNEAFEALEKRMKSLYGEGCKLDFILIDCTKVDIKIFRVMQDELVPFVTIAFHVFFRKYPECDLLKFVNMFSRKTLQIVNGRSSYSSNRYYVRSKLG